MIRQFKKAAICAAAGLACAGVNAATSDWGTHPSATVASMTPAANTFFEDYFSFSVPTGGGTLGSVVVANNLNLAGTDLYLIIGGAYGLYSNPDGVIGNADDVLEGAGMRSFDGLSGDLASVNGVAAGSYYYYVTGLTGGTAGGAYQLTSGFVANPVPEPQTWALMLAGLGVAGFAARRVRGD